jgi:hypothetical protein
MTHTPPLVDPCIRTGRARIRLSGYALHPADGSPFQQFPRNVPCTGSSFTRAVSFLFSPQPLSRLLPSWVGGRSSR